MMEEGVPVSGMLAVYQHDKKVLELRIINGYLYLRDEDGWKMVSLS